MKNENKGENTQLQWIKENYYFLDKLHSSKRHKAKILIIRARMTKGKCIKGRRGILN